MEAHLKRHGVKLTFYFFAKLLVGGGAKLTVVLGSSLPDQLGMVTLISLKDVAFIASMS
jgi:hypothetical protein